MKNVIYVLQKKTYVNVSIISLMINLYKALIQLFMKYQKKLKSTPNDLHTFFYSDCEI